MRHAIKTSHMWLFVLVLLSMILLTSGCIFNQEVPAENIDSQEEPVVEDVEVIADEEPIEDKILIASVHFPPFEVIENGSYTGPGYDIVTEAFSRMGYTEEDYEFVTYPWARILELVKSGDVDIVMDISPNEERQSYIKFSEEPFTNYEKHFITTAGNDIPYDGTIDSIKDYTIGVVREYRIGPNYQEARATGMYKFEDASSFEENIDKLLSGRVPIILDTTFSVLSHLANEGITHEIIVLEPPYDSTTTHLGFSKVLNNMDLLEGYDKAVREMREDGTLQNILDKYFK